MDRNKRERGGKEPNKPDLPTETLDMVDEKETAEEEAMIAQLLHGFKQMEMTIRQPEAPALHELEQLVAGHRTKLRKRAVLEWCAFLLIALMVIGGNLLLAASSIAVFVAIQGTAFVVILAFVLRFFQKSREKVKSGHA